MDPKIQAGALAQHQLSRAFGEWYANKQGILIVGLVVQVDGQAYRVLWASDDLPGHFLVIEDGSPEGTCLLETKALFHQPSADFGTHFLDDPRAVMEVLQTHLVDFLRDRPEAVQWLNTINESLGT